MMEKWLAWALSYAATATSVCVCSWALGLNLNATCAWSALSVACLAGAEAVTRR